VNHVFTNTAWEFGGLFSGLSGPVAWCAFGALALLGLFTAWLSYHYAVRPLTRGQRTVLILLRTGFLVTLLLCLANPVRVEKTTLQPAAEKHKLAVVVDRSDSMTMEDSRGRSRLSDALRTWRRLEPGAQGVFDETHYYSLAKDLRPATTLDAAAARTGDTGETWLYQSLLQLLATAPTERPDSVVVLTDGLDTTTEREDRLVARALSEGVSIYFVSGSNRLLPQPFVRVRELRAPATALRNSDFLLDGTIEAYSKEASTVPYTLWNGAEQIAAGNFSLAPGHNVLPWETHVNSGEPGEMDLVLRLGPTADAPPAARTATHVVAHEKIHVLFYQGALDWSFRYLIDALETDPSFDLTSLINPALNVTLTRGAGVTLNQLPNTVEGFKGFDMVILAHPYPAQLSPGQQQALIDFVRQGGDVLFTSPDPLAVPQFAGQPVAELLPVEFAANANNGVLSAIRQRAQEIEMINFGGGGDSASTLPLTPFTITPDGLALPVFAQAGNKAKTPLTPRFTEYAPVTLTKPGAEVLAVHPTDRDPATHNPYVLLATQIFGRGRTAILTTDGLWHWKLSEPSESHAVETFWQQLLLWLGQGHSQGPRFVDAPAQVAVGDQLPLRLAGVSTTHPPVVTARGPDGATKSLPLLATGDPDEPWTCTWTASAAGAWELQATGPDGTPTRIFLYAIDQPRGELSQSPPALDQMRALAEATRGALLDESTPSAWQAAEQTPPTIVNEQRMLLWDRWPVLVTAFAAFALELCLRRRWRLL
jgi:hypothetical protein